MTIEHRHDADLTFVKDTDEQQQRTIAAAVGKALAAIKSLEARADALEARLEQARQDQYLGALKAQLSRPVLAYELDETASILRRRPLFGDQP